MVWDRGYSGFELKCGTMSTALTSKYIKMKPGHVIEEAPDAHPKEVLTAATGWQHFSNSLVHRRKRPQQCRPGVLGPKDHINTRILQAMASGILLVFGQGSNCRIPFGLLSSTEMAST